jgi:hypothetical protein
MWTWGLGFMAFVTKTYTTDESRRLRLRLMVFAFFPYIAKMCLYTLLGRYKHRWGADLALWEGVGAVQGLFGEYKRSQKRIREIKARYA